MKNDKSNMITTFKVFETISTEGLKPSYLMTLSEYKEKVTPIFKSFTKFISKNTDYLKREDYYGFRYMDWDEYEKREKESIDRQYPDSWETWGKKMIGERWPNHKPLPQDVKNTYEEYLKVFTQIFGEKNIERVESDEVGSNKRSVRRALDDEMTPTGKAPSIYENLIKSGELTYEKFEEIVTSVGLKIPTGFNKKINFRPKVVKIEKSEEEKALIFKRIKNVLDSFIKKSVDAWSIGPRMTRNMYRISYSDVSMFKYMMDNFNFLDPEQKSELESVKEYQNYLNRVKEYIIKAGEKDAEFEMAEDEVYKKIINETKIEIQPAIDEHKEEIKEKLLEDQQRIKEKKEELSEDDFIKRYGNKVTDRKGIFVRYDMTKFENSVLGKLLVWSENQTDTYIKQQQDMYQKNEHRKISFLFYKLKTRFPNIIEFKFSGIEKRKRTGLEFWIEGWDKEGVRYFIATNAIFAGGYNIQVYHMRWLMSVSVDGKQVAAFKSEQ
jgi:hypothetical protein